MKALRRFLKWWRRFWRPGGRVAGSIDSHKWESKIELFRQL